MVHSLHLSKATVRNNSDVLVDNLAKNHTDIGSVDAHMEVKNKVCRAGSVSEKMQEPDSD
jgi:hypothetical protein